MDSGRPILPPEGPKKERRDIVLERPNGRCRRPEGCYNQITYNKIAQVRQNHFTKKVKTRPRDHQKRNQHVRFTPRGSEKRAPRQFKQFEQNLISGQHTCRTHGEAMSVCLHED